MSSSFSKNYPTRPSLIVLLSALIFSFGLQALGQTAPQLLPYATTLVAGGGTTATFTPGGTCPVSGKTASDKFGDGCLATEVQLNTPRYVTEDSQGNVFISDSKNALIRRVDATSGVITAIAGGAAANPASGAACGGTDPNTSVDWQGDSCLATSVKLSAPQGLSFSPLTGNLYFGDTGNGTVRMIAATNGVITTTGVITNVVGNVTGTKAIFGYAANTATSTINPATQGAIDDPYGVFVDKQGILYISEEFKNAILVVNTTAATITVAGISIPAGTIAKVAGFQSATDGAFCPNGTSGTFGCAFGKWTDGNPASTSQTDSPYDLVADSQGDIFFANEFNAAVAKISSAGIISTWAGTQASAMVTNQRGKANTIPIGSNFGLTIDTNGNIYTSDSLKGWIWRVDAANQGLYVIAGAGTPCSGTYGDGCPASETKFSTGTIGSSGTFANTVGVAGLYSDQAGTLFIADAVANLVHKITTNANFGTILPTQPTQTIDIHFGVNDGPGGTPYTLTSNPGNFSIGAATCTANSDTTTDCLLPITATPTQTTSGAFSSTLHIASALGGAADISLTGNLELEQLASNTALTLSTNSTNPASPVTLTAAVSSSAASVPATGTVTFYSGTTQIGTPQTLVNGQASIQYTFAAGTYSVTAVYGGSQFFFSSTSTPSSVTSVIPTFTLTPLQTTLTIAQGQTAAEGLTLIAAGGYAGTVTFACSGLPANTSCLFNPTSVTLGAAGSTVALSILTAGPGSSAVHPLALPGLHGGQVVFACLPGAALLLILVRRRAAGRFSALLSLSVLMIGTAFLGGCSNGIKTAPSTSPGTSTVTITATGTPNIVSTGTNIVQTVPLILVVTPQP
ncbi:MAG: Ig-like domain repeat protein [Edaphobacter sp.]